MPTRSPGLGARARPDAGSRSPWGPLKEISKKSQSFLRTGSPPSRYSSVTKPGRVAREQRHTRLGEDVKQKSEGRPPLPTQRAFVVQFRAETDDTRNLIVLTVVQKKRKRRMWKRFLMALCF